MQRKPSYISLLKQCVRHVIGLLRRPKPLRIIFPSTAELFSALLPLTPILRQAITAFQGGNSDHAQRLLKEHFRTRSQPQFFIAPQEVKPALDRLSATFPERYRSIGAAATENTTHHSQTLKNPDLWSGDIHLLQFAPLHAREALIEPRFRIALSARLQDWMNKVEAAADPPAYSNNLPAVFRGTGLTWALGFLLGATPSASDGDLEKLILKIILTDGRFVASRLGTSFPNNHLLADGFFLWYLGLLFPEFREAANWRAQGEVVWLEQFERQIYADGTSFEHSFHYHELACEMASCYLLLCAKNHISIPAWVKERIGKMLAFQCDIAGPEAIPIPFGDSGDHSLLSGLDSGGKWACAALRQIYRTLFEPSLPIGATRFSSEERAFWLLGGRLSEPVADSVPVKSHHYPLGGFIAFSDHNPSTRLIFRSGPALNALVNPGHMHADLLSIYVHIQGVPLIVDTGTYTYRSKAPNDSSHFPDWRTYCSSPYAHNGLVLESHDPLARGGGDFPGGPIQSRVNASVSYIGEKASWVEGKMTSTTPYSGYRRGVLHIPNTYWVVYDVLPNLTSTIRPSFGLQFSPETQLHLLTPHVIHADLAQAELLIATCQHHGAPTILRGGETPPAGWVAPQQGKKIPAPMLRLEVSPESPPLAMLLAARNQLAKMASIEIYPVFENALVFIIRYESCIDYVLLNPGEETVSWRGMQFKGAALWLHTLNEHPIELRWLNATQFDWADYGVSILAPTPLQELRITRQGENIHVESAQIDMAKAVFGKSNHA